MASDKVVAARSAISVRTWVMPRVCGDRPIPASHP
jgi:hypothetical protein